MILGFKNIFDELNEVRYLKESKDLKSVKIKEEAY